MGGATTNTSLPCCRPTRTVSIMASQYAADAPSHERFIADDGGSMSDGDGGGSGTVVDEGWVNQAAGGCGRYPVSRKTTERWRPSTPAERSAS